jgi:hypothetical protein
MKIYKYPIPFTDRIVLALPFGARVLCVQGQEGQLCLWAEIEETAPLVDRIFRVYGTGHVPEFEAFLDALPCARRELIGPCEKRMYDEAQARAMACSENTMGVSL